MNVHQHENNQESQDHLDENRKKFSNKCLQLLELLLQGKRLTVLGAANSGISSLPRRVLDCKEAGIDIQDEWLTDNEGKRTVKEYFINFKTDKEKDDIRTFIDSKTGNIYKPGTKTSSDYSKELIQTIQKSLF